MSRIWSLGNLEQVPQCPVCGSKTRTGRKFSRHHDDVIFDDMWSLVECAECHSLYLAPRPDALSLARAYEAYYTHRPESEGKLISRYNRLLLPLVNGYLNKRFHMSRKPSLSMGFYLFSSIEPLRLKLDYYGRHMFGRPGRLLDVGCGNGGFLLRAKEMGWQAEGCDPDPKAVAICQSLGLQVSLGDPLTLSCERQSYDGITMSHVIEHVPNPSRLLARCGELLKPGGRLWLATPNPDSLGLKIFGSSWMPLHPPYHFSIPTQTVLCSLLSKAGFEHVRLLRRGLQSPFTWHKSLEIAGRERIHVSRFSVTVTRILAELLATVSSRWGEETVIVAYKKPRL